MSGRESRARTVVAGIAAGGALLGHQLTYLLVHPTGSTGAVTAEHGWLSWASDLIVVATVFAIAALAVQRLARVARDRPVGLGELAVFQVGAFAAVEILERVVAGAAVSDLAVILPVGALVQVAVAALGAAALRRLLGAAERLRDLLAVGEPVRPRSARARVRQLQEIAGSIGLVRAASIRGPPALLPH